MLILKKFLILLFIFSSLAPGTSMAQDTSERTVEAVEELPVAVILSSTLEERPVAVSSAWLGYALSRLAWINDNVPMDTLEDYTNYGSFSEEFTGRESLVNIWGELKVSDPLLEDRYLDDLLLVQSNGFLREYVWTYFGNDSWEMPQEDFKFQKFAEWHAINLSGHSPETLAGLEIH